MIKTLKLCAVAMTLFAAGAAQATLIDRGAGMVYDTDLNITVLKDWNYAKTSNFAGADGTGAMNWDTAKAWASSLVYAGYSGWSLPTSLNQDGTGPCTAFFCSSSALGHLWYTELGNDAANFSTAGVFINMQPGVYWTSTNLSFNITPWGFNASNGYQAEMGGSGSHLFAVAIHAGDIAAVPEPQALVLMSLGLAGVVGAARQRRLSPAA